MNFPKKVIVTDQTINLDFLNERQKKYYFDLADELINLYSNSGNNRYIISMSGPSGSGKSVISKILEYIITSKISGFKFYTLDLDAFHFSNKYLIKKSLKQVKGRYDTYDTNLIKSALTKFLSGANVTFPIYSRKLHDPIKNGFVVNEEKVLLLVVGLWFTRNDAKWKSLRNLMSYNLYIKGPKDKIKQNTIKRHTIGGRSKKEATEFYDKSDLLNTVEILNNSVKPDKVIKYFENIG